MPTKKSKTKPPLYVQIKEDILEGIRSNELQPGGIIPTEHELAQQYSVSRSTVRQAITDLVYGGYLVRQQGRGTFVNKARIETKLGNFYSFAQDITRRGLKTASKIIEFEIVLPKASVREKLHLHTEHALVYKIIRLRYVDDEPTLLETTFLPCSLFPELHENTLHEMKSLYTMLEENYETKLDHVVDYFEPVLIDDYVSKLLAVPKGAPALYVERIGFLQNNTRAELSQSIMRGDRCRYFVELFRPNE